MPKIVIDPELCKACRLCIKVCPQGLLSIGEERNSKGGHYAVQSQAENCTGCRMCAIMCPDIAISVYK